jgi:hypothetical protein
VIITPMIFGTKVRLISRIWVTVWKMLTRMPMRRPAASSGPATVSTV